MKKAIPLTIAAVILCGSAWAQPVPGGDGGPAPIAFDSLDKNQDGLISKDEAKASISVTAAFDTADKNGDGTLSKSEFDAYFNAR